MYLFQLYVPLNSARLFKWIFSAMALQFSNWSVLKITLCPTQFCPSLQMDFLCYGLAIFQLECANFEQFFNWSYFSGMFFSYAGLIDLKSLIDFLNI
jgi:hypothetical protein